ncbi:MAG TPA: hypothetical protein VH165_28520 [Kofleriaceae bacterium]|nr:hypothetical protein [Kofleriaceae bacterium]
MRGTTDRQGPGASCGQPRRADRCHRDNPSARRAKRITVLTRSQPLADLLGRIAALGYRWGTGDGN